MVLSENLSEQRFPLNNGSGEIPALGFGTFVMIVLTVTQLVFRVMRVTLTEWVGETIPPGLKRVVRRAVVGSRERDL